jgi:hypothetical protein
MKEITVKGVKLKYKVSYSDISYEDIWYTEFYLGEKVSYVKKYLFWGEKQKVISPKMVFVVYYNIESPKFTKAKVREDLEREVELIFRQDEIDRGEII